MRGTPAGSLDVFQVWRCFGHSWHSYSTCDMINLSAADLAPFLLLILEDRNTVFKGFFMGVSWLEELADCEPLGKVQSII